MKYYLQALIVIIGLLLIGNSAVALDAVVASVDGRPITLYDLNSNDPNLRLKSIEDFKQNPAAKNLLEFLILQQLLISEAEKYRVSASATEIDQAIADMSAQAGLTPEQFAKKIASRGEDFDHLREQIRIEILKSKLSSKLFRASAVIKEEEIDAILESSPRLKEPGNKVKLKQIFLPAEVAAARFSEIQTELSKGSSFESLASRYSALENAKRGGSIGIISEEDLEPQLFDTLLIVAPGQISAPIKSSAGVSLFKVDERITVTDSLQELREMIRRDLTAGKERENFTDYFSRKIYLDHIIERIL